MKIFFKAITPALFCCALLASVEALPTHDGDKVLLESIKVLNFRKGEFTAARRSSRIPSLSCVGGDACRDFIPEVVSCKNAGFDGNEIGWECTADLPNNIRFGTTDVSCEGFNYPEDPYILKGSCGLEYTLHRNNPGSSGSKNYDTSYNTHYNKPHKSSSSLWSLFGIGFVVYLIWRFMYHPLSRASNSQTYSSGSTSGSGGGGGGYGGGYGGSGGYGGGGAGYGGGYGSGYNAPDCGPQQPNAGSGFWTGAGLGAMAGYLFGNRGRGYYRAPPSYGTGYSSYGSYGSASAGSHGSSGSSGTSDTGSRSATGYGTTRRR